MKQEVVLSEEDRKLASEYVEAVVNVAQVFGEYGNKEQVDDFANTNWPTPLGVPELRVALIRYEAIRGRIMARARDALRDVPD